MRGAVYRAAFTAVAEGRKKAPQKRKGRTAMEAEAQIKIASIKKKQILKRIIDRRMRASCFIRLDEKKIVC
jgi:hypothetical protein